MESLYVSLIVGILGGILSSLLGWLESEPSEPFIPKKLVSGILRAGIGGVIVAYLFPVQQVPKDLVLLFLSAMGIDINANNVVKILKKNLGGDAE